jgi:hypothetical protein
MKKSIEFCLATLLIILLFSVNGFSQNIFKEKVVPYIDTLGSPYKFVDDNTIMLTYCGTNVDCVPVYITNQYLYEDEISRVVQCFTILFSDNISTPPKSLVQKLSDLNAESKFGKFGISVQEDFYCVFYQNETWFDELDYNTLYKNIQVNYITSIGYKNEFSVFKDE